MRQMCCELEMVTQVDPTPQSPNHCSATSWKVTEPYCECHKFEHTLLPVARRSGWPEILQLDRLVERILSLQDDLADLIHGPHGNEFFDKAACFGSHSELTRQEAHKQLMLMGKMG